MSNSFYLHVEWSLNIAFVNQFYCMHHGIGFKIIEFLQTFAMFSIGGLFYSYIFVCFNIFPVQMTIVSMEVV